jgi:hypothetical protein
MRTRRVQLIDPSRAVWATAQVDDEGGYFGGTIDLRSTPAHLQALFQEFEEIVNNQMFAFLDDVQERIGSLPIKAVFEDGLEVDVEDLQVFPCRGDVSFRLAGVPSHNAKPA